MNETISKAINLLRFPLACLIVLKHYYTPDISADIFGGEVYNFIGLFVTKVFTAVPVPLFMMISGYLYFNKCNLSEGFSRELYINKTRSRIKSLLIPYLIWNLLVFLFFTVGQSLTAGSDVMQKDGYKALADYEVIDYLKNFWALDSTGFPIDGPLWFIRDLFIISLFSPFVFWGIKYLRWFFMLIVIVLRYIHVDFEIPYIDYKYQVGIAEVYFIMGASFMLLSPKLPTKLIDRKVFPIIVFLTGIGIFGLMYSKLTDNIQIETPALWCYRTFGAFMFFAIAEFLSKKNVQIATWITTASFFIFAIHKPIQVIIRRGVFAILHPSDEIILISLIFIVPTIVILISLGVFYAIRRWMPWLKCLNGYRL